MKIFNQSTGNEYIGISGLQHSKASILISNGIKYDKPGRRIVAPMYGKTNILGIAKSHREANIRDIEIVIDSKNHPELSAKVLAENMEKDRLAIVDVETGINYAKCDSFTSLWEGYKMHPSPEIANLNAKFLIQKIPLQFNGVDSCLAH
ncbi:hypothetical protein REH81_33945, partial [Vibrio rotiferianus]